MAEPVTSKARGKPQTQPCIVCGRHFRTNDLRPWHAVRPTLSALIEHDHPEWGESKFICHDDLAAYRRRYVEGLLKEERGELGALERQVVDSIETGQIISAITENEINDRFTFGERMADRVAAFGGSWTFILSFLFVLALWITLNATGLMFRPFDVYPFILLNLALSCLAAMQAPVIMMSQRRQEAKDRLRAENDYKINLKAELEIRQLHEKIDHQLARQWERLAEMQQIQIDLLEERHGGRHE